jgi:hypothetical protein
MWRTISAALAGTALLAVGPLLLMTALIVKTFSDSSALDPDRTLIYNVIWFVVASTVAMFNLIAGVWLAIRPRVSLIKGMLVAAAIVVIGFPLIWAPLFR